MKKNIAIAAITLLTASVFAAPDQSLDKELSALTEQLASAATNAGVKKIATLDFTDLQGNPTELGRFIAEQVAVNMVMSKRPFAVVDRANLKRILDEHKLSMSGLVNPENTKKLGQFSGVDAIILGRITPMADSVAISATITLTETAEVVGGAKSRIPKSQDVLQLLDRSVLSDSMVAGITSTSKEDESLRKDFEAKRSFFQFDALKVDLDSFRFLQSGEILATLIFTNIDKNKAMQVALKSAADANTFGPPCIRGSLSDDLGYEYKAYVQHLTGISAIAPRGRYGYGITENTPEYDVSNMTLLEPGKTIKWTIRFAPQDSKQKEAGVVFKMQCEIIVGERTRLDQYKFKLHNLFIEGIKPHAAKTQ